MNASELEYVWKSQPPLELSPHNIALVASRLRAEDGKFRRRIWWRDLREIGTALTLAIVISLAGQTSIRWIAVGSCFFVIACLVWSRRDLRPADETSSVVERLRQMIRETDTQIRLLRSVFWWYLLPCGIGTLALVADRRPFDPSHLPIIVAAMCPVYIAVYWLNQRAVRKELLPRRTNLEHALAELEEPS